MVNAAFPKLAEPTLDKIEGDLRAEHLNDQGLHRKVQEVRADLGRTLRALNLLDVGAAEIKVTLDKSAPDSKPSKMRTKARSPGITKERTRNG